MYLVKCNYNGFFTYYFVNYCFSLIKKSRYNYFILFYAIKFIALFESLNRSKTTHNLYYIYIKNIFFKLILLASKFY